MNTRTFTSLDRSCDDALYWIREQLTQAGLRSVQTFDLHAARTGSHNCPCPNHGTDACDCQMVILLVFGASEEPVSLLLHGNDGQTWLSIVETIATTHTDSLTNRIIDILCRRQSVETSKSV